MLTNIELWSWPVLCLAAAVLALLHLLRSRVTTRKRFEALLRASHEREAFLSQVITSEPSCVKTVSRDLKLLSMNPAGLTAVEADSLEQVQGADLRQVVHPDHLQDFIDLNDRVFSGERVSLRFRIVGLKGTERWMETYAAPMRGADGQVLYHLAVTNEITDRVVMEQRLVQARDAAIAGTRAKSEFLANMSHEIRTPMTSILGWAEVLGENAELGSEHIEKLRIIQRNGEHLLGILDDLLDLSRIESGKEQVRRDQVSPAQLVHDVKESLSPMVEGRPVELLTELAPDLPELVYADRQRVHQVLVNLTNNAIKFTSAGSVSIRLHVERESETGSLVFCVVDTGPGIGPEDLQRMFQAFEQADTTVSRQHGGVGLGLAISRGIAELLNGSLDLSSARGEGTTATLRLPLELVTQPIENTSALPESTDEDVEAAAGECEGWLANRRILLAEDGADNQLLITHLLRRAGCRVEVAGDGREAVEMAAGARSGGEPFDLILMDVQMPVMDGHSATRELRQQGVAIPIIALTAHAMVGDRERALAAGCDGYLTKPVKGQTLVAELSRRLPARH